MALTQKHRSSIYTKLEPILGGEETEALLSQFPSRELDEPVTKEFVRAEISDVRAEISTVRVEISELRAEMLDRLRAQTIWMAGALLAGMGMSATIAAAIS